MNMTIYRGHRRRDPRTGRIDYIAQAVQNGAARSLPLRLDLSNHSPMGFSWGYRGSGPAQLALAILADHFNNDATALALYQDFKELWVIDLDRDAEWELTGEQLDAVLIEGGKAGNAAMFNAVMARFMTSPEVDAMVRAALREKFGPPLSGGWGTAAAVQAATDGVAKGGR
jgi:Family of unknown function (DUF6166)